MLHNINPLYLHRVFHGIRFKVNNEDWLSVRIAFFYARNSPSCTPQIIQKKLLFFVTKFDNIRFPYKTRKEN
mgnify:FL=1